MWQGCTSSSKNVGRWHRHAETVLDAAPHLEDMANSLCVYEVAPFKFFLHGVEKRDKKLCSTLNFWICILFFICAKNTENQLSHQHFSVENNYFCNVCVCFYHPISLGWISNFTKRKPLCLLTQIKKICIMLCNLCTSLVIFQYFLVVN